MQFPSDIDGGLKASVGSVKITSGGVGGGGLIASIGIVGFCCLLYGRRSGRNRSQSQPEVFDEFDLPTEQREEEFEDEEENVFDLRMHFDGDESFAGWGM
jgi:hypothetical protein